MYLTEYSVCLLPPPAPKPRTGHVLRNTAELHPPSGPSVSTLCRRLRPWLMSFPHKVKITTCSTSALDERFWWDRITPEGSGTAHIHLTKKKTCISIHKDYIRTTAEEHLLTGIFTDTEHTVLTKDMVEVTAVRHSMETEAWLYCVNTIKSAADVTEKLLCLKFSH